MKIKREREGGGGGGAVTVTNLGQTSHTDRTRNEDRTEKKNPTLA